MTLNEFYANDSRFSEYLKTTEEPTWIGFELYCSDLYQKTVDTLLSKYSLRNKNVLTKLNHKETYDWLLKYVRKEQIEIYRFDAGDEYLKAYLQVCACFNAITMELTKSILEINAVDYLLNIVKNQISTLNKDPYEALKLYELNIKTKE